MSYRQLHRVQHRRGFTLVELLIVIVLIGILSSVGVVAYRGVVHNSANQQGLSLVDQWADLLHLYRAQTGKYPVTDATLPYSGGKVPDGFPVCLGKLNDGYCYRSYTSGDYNGVGNINGVSASDISQKYEDQFAARGFTTPQSSVDSPIIVKNSTSNVKVTGIRYGYNITSNDPMYKGVFIYYVQYDKTCRKGDEETNIQFGYPVGSPLINDDGGVNTNETVSCRHKIADSLS